jgi:FlaA1/EpsC-like NDP-sugar epimerase
MLYFYGGLAGIGRFALLLLSYIVLLTLALALSLMLRFDFYVEPQYWERFRRTVVWLLPLKLIMLWAFGQFRTLLTYFSLPDAKGIAAAMGISGLIALIVWFIFGGENVVPRGVIVSDMVVSFLTFASFRICLRIYREKIIGIAPGIPVGHARRTAIIGAGTAGAALLRDIQARRGLGLDVVCFIDDDRRKIGSTLHGKQVLGPTTRLEALASELELQKVIIAMPSATPALIKRLAGQIHSADLDHEILPSVVQLLHREVTVTHLRSVNPEDLLGREPVVLNHEGIGGLIREKVVLITGAGGSIGSELCRQVAVQNPSKLVLVERSEAALFAIEQELMRTHRHVELVCSASSICDELVIGRLLEKVSPQIIFHAAAHKHVPLMEIQPAEALRNNVVGTEIMARLAERHKVHKFILISTDKAVNPTSVMGATKRLAEMVIEEYQSISEGNSSYAAVRFGNVLGSSGSVVPTFRRQIAEGGPVTVTHPNVTRYFMSIPEAVGLILQSAHQAQGGEIFVLDMGDPVKITDLARQMIELSGLVPGEDIKIAFTGLRPGEKLFEEPIHAKENIEPTIHPKVRKLRNNRGASTVGLVQELVSSHKELTADGERVKQWLSTKVPEYIMWEGGSSL